MNLIKTICSLFALTGIAAESKAANLKLEVYVPSYGYVLVLPGSNTGGRVLRATSGQLFTDRMARGESYRFGLSPSSPAEYNQYGHSYTQVGISYGSTINYLVFPTTYEMPYASPVYTVPVNPNIDNVVLEILTFTGNQNTRLPIGKR